MRASLARITAYAPWFEPRVARHPGALLMLAGAWLHADDPALAAHPAWGLTDAQGAPLWRTPPADGHPGMRAVDVGDAGFRAYWIDQARTRFAAGRHGLWLGGGGVGPP